MNNFLTVGVEKNPINRNYRQLMKKFIEETAVEIFDFNQYELNAKVEPNDLVLDLTEENIININEFCTTLENNNYLDKQSIILENQNNRIKNMENVHFANISKIGREFANQSAKLALSKYMKEKDDIEVLKSTGISSVDSMPSVKSFRSV
jgi:hypothetical protein